MSKEYFDARLIKDGNNWSIKSDWGTIELGDDVSDDLNQEYLFRKNNPR